MVILTTSSDCSFSMKFVTVHKQSCGKVMFSQLSVCHSVQGFPMWPVPMMHWDMGNPPIPDTKYGTSSSPSPRIANMGPTPSPCYWHLVVITGDLFKLAHLRTHPLMVLTSSGGHQNMHGRQANGTHPTGMLFCSISFKNVQYLFQCPVCSSWSYSSHSIFKSVKVNLGVMTIH